MASPNAKESGRPRSILREFLEDESSGGLVLMAAAAFALIVANSPLAPAQLSVLKAYIGPLNVLHWINDGLMAIFFLLVGLEIKREVLDGQLATWPRRALPGIAAAGGMIVPALIFAALNWGHPNTLRGWAIPAATDIAFALGLLSLLGPRVPASLKVFLTALAIIDDLGAIVIIAVFYSSNISYFDIGLAVVAVAALMAMNRAGVTRLWPYLIVGAFLWVFVLRSGVHATIAGVALAFTIPLRSAPGQPDEAPAPGQPDDAPHSPLHRLEHGLHRWVAFLVIPIFGLANAGVSFGGLTAETMFDHLTLGVVLGLFVGKLVGVFGSASLAIRLGLADLPRRASWRQLLGVSLLCGIGFTMSLFIGLLAFANDPALQSEVKIGIVAGSLLAGLSGWAVLRFATSPVQAQKPALP